MKHQTKQWLKFVFFLGLFLSIYTGCNKDSTDVQPRVLTFNDEFDGNKLDETKWQKRFRWGEIIINEELQAYVDSAFIVQDGILRIECKKDTVEYGGQILYYSSGVMTSYFQQTYGYFEIRCRMPEAGIGLWPAFWLLSANDTVFQEIDILEWYGAFSNAVEMTIHLLEPIGSVGKFYEGQDFSDDFHTFAVQWNNESVVWFIDGIERHRYDGQSNPSPMYIIVNLAIASIPPVGPPDENTPFPAYFDIDYIRVYNK